MATTTANKNGALPETRKMTRSVKDPQDGKIVSFFLPHLSTRTGALPPNLPPFGRWSFNSARDILLMSTINKEDQWAAAVGLAIDQQVVKGWEVDSEIPIRRNRAQQWLLEAGAGFGLFGFTKFLTAHLLSYILTGIAYIEIERSTPATGSKVVNIHHLNPLQCRLTGNTRYPVHYQSLNGGGVKRLSWHQVIVISDKVGIAREGQMGPSGAAERAYNTIRKLANIENFIDEKISGRRPLSINFIGGITKRAIDEILQSAQHEADAKALRSYMGAAMVAVPGDSPITNVSIPIAELPDITDVERERNRADLIYANALGIDPQDINPQIVGRQGLGSSGNQSQVLSDKTRGRGLAKWSKEFSLEINQLALDDTTTFTFTESDLRDQGIEADNRQKRADTRKTMIGNGEITADQSRNLAVDAGDLPPEFLEEDATGADKLRDDQKPDTPEEKIARAARPEMEKPEPKEEAKPEKGGAGKTAVKARSRGGAEQRAMFAKMGSDGSLQAKGPSGKRTVISPQKFGELARSGQRPNMPAGLTPAQKMEYVNAAAGRPLDYKPEPKKRRRRSKPKKQDTKPLTGDQKIANEAIKRADYLQGVIDGGNISLLITPLKDGGYLVRNGRDSRIPDVFKTKREAEQAAVNAMNGARMTAIVRINEMARSGKRAPSSILRLMTPAETREYNDLLSRSTQKENTKQDHQWGEIYH